MKEKKVYVVGSHSGSARFIKNAKIAPLEKANIAIFTGGEDINPKIYGAKKHPTTYFTSRDKFEIAAYEQILRHNNIKLIIGICRGAQLACALNGGLLIQDVSNHHGAHLIKMKKSQKEFQMSSLHHQMMYPFEMPKDKYEILASSAPSLSSHYEGDKIKQHKITEEPEIVMFYGPKKTLGIQGHPEWMPEDSEAVKTINKIIDEHLQF